MQSRKGERSREVQVRRGTSRMLDPAAGLQHVEPIGLAIIRSDVTQAFDSLDEFPNSPADQDQMNAHGDRAAVLPIPPDHSADDLVADSFSPHGLLEARSRKLDDRVAVRAYTNIEESPISTMPAPVEPRARAAWRKGGLALRTTGTTAR